MYDKKIGQAYRKIHLARMVVTAALLLAWVAVPPAGNAAAPTSKSGIDRHALVTRHNITLDRADPDTALQVGNGEFAFGVDVTGLQTFYGNTLSQWGWHSFPLPPGETPADLKMTPYDTYGRSVGYATSAKGQEAIYNWLRRIPTGSISAAWACNSIISRWPRAPSRIFASNSISGADASPAATSWPASRSRSSLVAIRHAMRSRCGSRRHRWRWAGSPWNWPSLTAIRTARAQTGRSRTRIARRSRRPVQTAPISCGRSTTTVMQRVSPGRGRRS